MSANSIRARIKQRVETPLEATYVNVKRDGAVTTVIKVQLYNY